MTITEFDNARFGVNTRVKYQDKEYPIAGVDFEEKLIGLDEFPNDEDADISWKRCENCELVN